MEDQPKFLRQSNKVYRDREYMTIEEVNLLIDVAGSRGRHPIRDRALLLLMFRHGLRAGEACTLRWGAVMFKEKRIAITRLKGSESGVHRLQEDEVDLLTELRDRYPDSYYIFPNERGEKLTVDAIDKIIKQAGKLANLPFSVHPHMMRHSCGYHLGNQGMDARLIQEYLGHRNIQHTVRYTRLNPARFDVITWDCLSRKPQFMTTTGGRMNP